MQFPILPILISCYFFSSHEPLNWTLAIGGRHVREIKPPGSVGFINGRLK